MGKKKRQKQRIKQITIVSYNLSRGLAEDVGKISYRSINDMYIDIMLGYKELFPIKSIEESEICLKTLGDTIFEITVSDSLTVYNLVTMIFMASYLSDFMDRSPIKNWSIVKTVAIFDSMLAKWQIQDENITVINV